MDEGMPLRLRRARDEYSLETTLGRRRSAVARTRGAGMCLRSQRPSQGKWRRETRDPRWRMFAGDQEIIISLNSFTFFSACIQELTQMLAKLFLKRE